MAAGGGWLYAFTTDGALHVLDARQGGPPRPVARLADWLSLLGFALEKRRFGCYRPPLSAPVWQARLAGLERWGPRLQAPGAGFYLLVARKLVVGLRPLRPPQRAGVGKLLPLPVAKVSRRDSER